MGHIHAGKEEVYRALAERLGRNPVGVVINENLMKILKSLYTETEAGLGVKFPMKPVTFEDIVKITGMPEQTLRENLEKMAGKGLVMDILHGETVYYLLTPMVIGFFEYTFMRAGSVGSREMAELFERYFNNEGVAKELFGSSTKMFKTLIYEKLIPAVVHTEVLSYEKASEIIRKSGGGSLGMCSCRHKAVHLGKACGMPVEEVCTTMGPWAEWMVRRGFSKKASVDDLLRNLERSEKLGLVMMVDNVLNRPAYICHCCGCCCTMLRAFNEHRVMPVHTSNFISVVDTSLCLGCAACEDSCHIHAITMDERAGLSVIDSETCLGCGVCVNSCPSGALEIRRRETLNTPPKNKTEQFAGIALERERLEFLNPR